MVKSRLPRDWELKLPSEVLHYMYSFIPHNPSMPKPSPRLQEELKKLQNGDKKTPMYLKGLDDFVLE
jgi:hypothetical protein